MLKNIISDQLECTELCLGTDEKTTENLLDQRIKGRAGTGDFILGICYRLMPARKIECLRYSIDRYEQSHIYGP